MCLGIQIATCNKLDDVLDSICMSHTGPYRKTCRVGAYSGKCPASSFSIPLPSWDSGVAFAPHAKLHSAEHLKGARVSLRRPLQSRAVIMPPHAKLNLTAVLGKGGKSGRRLQDDYTLGQVLGESG